MISFKGAKIQEKKQSIYFSENGFIETLWLKYADMHIGFILISDLSNYEDSHCRKMDKCKKYNVSKCGFSMYPVYYTNIPYDATEFTKCVMV